MTIKTIKGVWVQKGKFNGYNSTFDSTSNGINKILPKRLNENTHQLRWVFSNL